MKKIALAALVMIAFSSTAQNNLPGSIVDIRHAHPVSSIRETVIWSEDFAAGIPAGWENTEVVLLCFGWTPDFSVV